MINLLPLQEKNRILKEYRLRVFAVSLAAILPVLVAACATFFPVYVTVLSRKAQYVGETQTAAALSLKSKEKNNEEAAKLTNERTALLLSDKKDLLASEIFAEILQNKPRGIAVSSVSFGGEMPKNVKKSEAAGATVVVTINGKSATRPILTDFVNQLKKKPNFTFVNLPVSNLISDKDLSYAITVYVKPM